MYEIAYAKTGVKFSDDFLHGDVLVFWQAEVIPQLEMNALHLPRLSRTDSRHLVVHDAVVRKASLRVSSHPDKLRCLLDAYPCTLIPLPVKAPLAEGEQRSDCKRKREVVDGQSDGV